VQKNHGELDMFDLATAGVLMHMALRAERAVALAWVNTVL
jgi:hypothetical protein